MASNLPPLGDVARLSPRVVRILGANPGKYTLQGTNTYLVGTGRSRVLIDTGQGFEGWKVNLTKALADEDCSVSTVLLTHWHPDHVRGVPDLLAACPQAVVHKFPAGPPIDARTEPIADGQVFEIEGARLTAVHAPGHTDDHTAFVLADEDDAVFSGDAVLGHGTAVFEDLSKYMRCLETLEGACGEEARLYPAHGDVVKNGRSKVREYAEHRKTRETEVLRTVKNGPPEGLTPMEIVKIVYVGYPQALLEPAEGGVRKILDKLASQALVLEDGGNWKLGEKPAL